MWPISRMILIGRGFSSVGRWWYQLRSPPNLAGWMAPSWWARSVFTPHVGCLDVFFFDWDSLDGKVSSSDKKWAKSKWTFMVSICFYQWFLYVLVGGFKHFLFSISYMGWHPFHWRTHIFQDGFLTTNQCFYATISIPWCWNWGWTAWLGWK